MKKVLFKEKQKSFFDMSANEKKRIIIDATKESVKDQQKLVELYKQKLERSAS